ncbi:MAG: hypothetical protein IJZ07_01750 [Clostridia bacterium]|nr:hypothetical protein [Clostridia bacterium]
MATIIIRIITLAMSISIFFTSVIPARISGKDYEVVPENQITVSDSGFRGEGVSLPEGYKIISEYNDWIALDFGDDKIKSSYDKKYFETNNLVVAAFLLPNPGYETHVINAAECGDTLLLNCVHIYDGSMVIQILDTNIVLVETGKEVKNADISSQKMTVPIAF